MKNMKIIKTEYGKRDITIFEKEPNDSGVEQIAIHLDFEPETPRTRDMFFLTIKEAKQLIDILNIEVNRALK